VRALSLDVRGGRPFSPGWLLNSGFPLVGPVPPLETGERMGTGRAVLLGCRGELEHIILAEEGEQAERRLTETAGLPTVSPRRW
jgi:hypothetical protein